MMCDPSFQFYFTVTDIMSLYLPKREMKEGYSKQQTAK